ncbi:Phosphate-induced protein 1 conserved region [Musa troglodytarum]|uniref:Phosphate-induced protein 1 conserved region n=1 Tax=Musa troglodytarum TaxID=320322 RepID=A0A9E7H8E8_9LILI|nr:Phosphate-induced protein 1 conserved region [Musa troglodytarum]
MCCLKEAILSLPTSPYHPHLPQRSLVGGKHPNLRPLVWEILTITEINYH